MFDPSTLGDPQALQAQWTPLKPGGANFTTHALRDVPEGLEYRKNAKTFLFGGLFLVVGLGVTAASVSEWWLALIGVPFVAAGAWVVWPTTVRFDSVARAVTVRGQAIPFSGILAVQLLTEHIRDQDGDYDSHELNLVLADGSRLNLVDHGGKQVLRDDLHRLRALIGCKAWDGTRH